MSNKSSEAQAGPRSSGASPALRLNGAYLHDRCLIPITAEYPSAP